MNPDKIARPIDFDNFTRKGGVGGLIVGVVGVCGSIFCCDVLPEQVVEQRPKGCKLSAMEEDKKRIRTHFACSSHRNDHDRLCHRARRGRKPSSSRRPDRFLLAGKCVGHHQGQCGHWKRLRQTARGHFGWERGCRRSSQ